MSEPFRRHRMAAVTHLKQEPTPMTELIDTTDAAAVPAADPR